MMQKPDLYSMTLDELTEYVTSIGERSFRAKQIYDGIYSGNPIGEIHNIPKILRDRLSEQTLDTLPRIQAKLVSKIDGTVKYLFRLHDGACIESVLMKYKHGNSLCISTQVGCRMGCRFCASTIGGKERDLYPSELIGQIIVAQRDTKERVSNVVMMGIGEPLDNFDNVVKFLRLVNDEAGLNIGYRHISLSTSGIVPKIRELAELSFPITLSISLHAATDAARSEIMPVNNKWNISELLSACNDYFAKTGRRISFEYTLIHGKNDSDADALALAKLLTSSLGIDVPIHVNLIRVNEVKESGYCAGSSESAKRFADILNKKGGYSQ